MRFIATISVALATANGLSLVIGSHAVNPGIGKHLSADTRIREPARDDWTVS